MAQRGNFSSKAGFIAAAAGSAVGLGNIWKFPYEAGENGGAAFLMIYMVSVLLIGFPLIVAEIAMGRKGQTDAIGTYKKLGGKNWGFAGLLGVICAILFLSFYNVVAGWSFGYFYQIVFGDLLQQNNFGSYFGEFAADVSDNVFFSLVFMLITAFIVARGVQKGIETFSKILMPSLLILLVGLVIYAMTLENAMAGIQFYLVPDFSQITGKTIYKAMGQAFFSLSLGVGGLITYGSYFGKKENIVSNAAVIAGVDLLVAFLAGLLIFPLVFSQGQEPTAGPGLVFVALPGIFAAMGPVIGKVIGGAFFLLLCFAALTSTISILEIPSAYFVDQKKMDRKKVVYSLSIFIFILGLPSLLSIGAVDALTNLMVYEGQSKSFLDLIADVSTELTLPFGGFLVSVVVALKWKKKGLSEEISKGYPGYAGSFMEKFINLMISTLCPLVLGLTFITTILQKFFNVVLI
jgi:neurotransmitter:Na+ symporter, NSS family